MTTKLLSQHPLLIGQILARSAARSQRRNRLRQLRRFLLSPLRLLRPIPRAAHISPTEVIYSHAPR